jgi:thiol-disulfide isomerase/thioredoxin
MKYILSTFFIVFLLNSCGTKAEKSEVISTPPKGNFLEGLTILEPQDYDSLGKLNLFGATTVPFYTEDGELIPFSKRMDIITSGNYTTTIYVDNKKNIRLWTVRLTTDEEKRKLSDSNSLPEVKHALLNKPAIPFIAEDLNGRNYSLENQKGKIIVMNFWFLGCHPCIQEIIELNKLVEANDESEIIFLAFALDKKDKLIPFLKKNKFKYHIIPECQSIHRAYEVTTCPTHIVIDKNSKVKYYSIGGIKPNMKNNLEIAINQLLEK